MIGVAEQHYVLPAGVSTAVIVLLAFGAAAAWVATHFLPRGRRRRVRVLLAGLRLVVGFGAMLGMAQLAQRLLLLGTNWPIWPLALAVAAGVEVILGLYALERRTVSRRTGVVLALLRAAAVVLVVAMLAQPVVPLNRTETIPRCIAVLMDESASMHVPDTQMTAPEKVRLAEMLGVKAARRFYRLDVAARKLGNLGEELSGRGEWLAMLGEVQPDLRSSQLAERRSGMHEGFQEMVKVLDEQINAVARATDGRLKLPTEILTELQDVKSKLTAQVRDRLVEAATITHEDAEKELPRQYERLRSGIPRAAAALGTLAETAAQLAEKIDERLYESLSPEQKREIDAVARKTRFELGCDALLHSGGGDTDKNEGESLMQRLRKKYEVRSYVFAGSVTEVTPDHLGSGHNPGPRTRPADQPTTGTATAPAAPDFEQQTDVAAALQQVMTDVPADRLAGVVLLTDGQHNAAGKVEPVARRLGLLNVPVCSVALGSSKPPTDAAILALEAPETVYAKDTMYVTAKLKLDGLAGKTVRVTLYDKDKSVDVQDVRVPTDSYRTQIQLSDTPGKSGLHAYRAVVQKFDGEVFATNNEHPLLVSVTDDRVQMLLADGLPRWEFRYLKNLFASRDRTVKLQYVLFRPDRVAGMKDRPQVVAAAGQPAVQVEATALPEKPSEWMKFDVIVLGDVSPQFLSPVQLDAIRKFVIDRGGTLIVIAGPRHMPEAYRGTAMEELLPVRLRSAVAPGTGIDTKKGFHIDLTPSGRESVILRQSVDPDENRKIWSSFPTLYWRLPIAKAKRGAEVLAYALPPSAPKYMSPARPARREADEKVLELRRNFMRDNALISMHKAGMGQVMFLGFDRTWRLRYRKGDVHHHKLWGQVLRWATANKLPAGTDLVKIGTDRARYAPDSRVLVRAKIVRADLSPVVSKEVAAVVYSGEKLLLRRKFEYRPDSPGIYSADLGALPSGTYRVEVDGPPVKDILAAEGVKKVATEFSVEGAVPAEQTELWANRGLLGRLASLTGGAVAEPSRALELLEVLGPGALLRTERKQYVLWDNWWYLAVILALVTAEWLLRKKVGLA
ncbi:MAG TPA: hypothetical protein VMZ50_10345 [Phycisphaerae bacterium]|nr:hypothetical protein [Phycisphaerae bacterium]